MRRIVLSIGVFAACLLAGSLASAQAPQAPQTLVVTVDRSSLRERPATDARVVATLPSGEQLELLDTTGLWSHVRVKRSGRTGYVSSTVVQAAPTGLGPTDLEAWMEALRRATPGAGARQGGATTPGAPPPAAQPTPRPRPPASKDHPGVHAFGIVDIEAMTASESFKAVLDSGKAQLTSLGFGLEGTSLWRGLFVRVAYTHSSDTGTRVFVDSSMVAHSLHNPLTIEITPIEIGAGWRFGPPPPKGTTGVRPYAGGALLLQRYKESSNFASDAENTDVTDKGLALFAGFEIGVKFVRIGIEGQFRTVPSAIGAGGASLAYDEKDLGGGIFRLTFGVGF
jgi:hypothetical protein